MVQCKRAAQGSEGSGDQQENLNLMQSPAKARCRRVASGDTEASSKDGSCASSPAKHRGAGQGGPLLQLAEAAAAVLQEEAAGAQRSCPRCMQSFPVDGVQASAIQREKDPQRKIVCGHFVCKECREAGDTWAQGQDSRYQNMVESYCRRSLHTPIDGQGGNQTEGLAYISGKTLAVGGFLAHWRERLLFLALVLAPVHLVKGNYLSDVLGRDRDMRKLTKRLAFTLVFLVREPLFYCL